MIPIDLKKKKPCTSELNPEWVLGYPPVESVKRMISGICSNVSVMCLYESGFNCKNTFHICALSWEHLRILVSTQTELQWIWGHVGENEFGLLTAGSLLMTLFCSWWFPGDIWYVLWSRPSLPDKSVLLSSNSYPRRAHSMKDCCADCSNSCVCVCVGACMCVVRKSSSDRCYLRVSPSVRLNCAPEGHNLYPVCCVCIACEMADICYCTQMWVWICMTSVMWISEKKQCL